jgi:hypothetical protein
LERRKRPGFGGTTARDPKQHGQAIQTKVENVIAAQKKRMPIAGIEPALILKIRTTSTISEQDWAKLDLTLLASDREKTLVLFADDGELTEFKKRILAYQEDPPAGQKNPAYNALLGAIEDVGELTGVDRIGSALRENGFQEPASFTDHDIYTLDIELWQPERDKADLFVHWVTRRAVELDGIVISEYRGNAITLVRIRGSGKVFREILELPEVAEIDLPPQPELSDQDVHGITVANIGDVRGPPEGATTVGIIDSGVSSGHPFLEGGVSAALACRMNWVTLMSGDTERLFLASQPSGTLERCLKGARSPLASIWLVRAS